MSKAHILFEDGTIFHAEANLNEKTVLGEIVFNTAMTGYQEILTDPSYAAQIVVMTYPLIGNYGVEKDFAESKKIQVTALIVKENSETEIKDVKSLSDYLAENETLCLTGLDTRKLTKIIRSFGSKNCLITTEEISEKHIQMLKDYTFPKDIVSKLSERKITKYSPKIDKKCSFALIDYGSKNSILNKLLEKGAEVTTYPFDTKAEEIIGTNHDAVLLSNGPGDPKDVDITNIKELIGKLPVFGICLGHQILALALGGNTYKLKFGHRGANHPILNLKNGKVLITSQNHGYAVEENSLPENAKITFKNINDNTVEGFECENLKVKCTQFHPEAAPGPNDAEGILQEWINSVCKGEADA